MLPDLDEVRRHLLPWVEPLRARLPHITTDLNLSTSAAFGHRVCLGLVIRLHDAAGRSQVKIRIAAFFDVQGRVHWEVGFVDNARSLQRLRRNFVQARPVRHEPAMLRGLVDATCALAALRPAVVALDLTPAHFHVLPLCLAMGGKPVLDIDLRKWSAELQQAALFSLERLERAGTPLPHRLTWAELRAIKLRYVVAWLFTKGWMFDPASGQPLSWTPPRLLRFSDGSARGVIA